MDEEEKIETIETSKQAKPKSALKMLDLSDCTLSLIFAKLDAYELYVLSLVCRRFEYLINERKLWVKINLRSHPMCARKFQFFFKRIHDHTTHLMLTGISRREKCITFNQFIFLNNVAPNLTVLVIDNQYINTDEVALRDFPSRLKEISLSGTHLYGKKKRFLQNSHQTLLDLHTLVLNNCNWILEYSLMSISKLPSLENLSLNGCANLNDSIAYMSLTTRFGFRKLLRIDVRWTKVGDQFVKCFFQIPTLREIYLENRNTKPEKKSWWNEFNKQVISGLNVDQSTYVVKTRTLYQLKDTTSSNTSSPFRRQKIRQPTVNCVVTAQACSIKNCSLIPENFENRKVVNNYVHNYYSDLKIFCTECIQDIEHTNCSYNDYSRIIEVNPFLGHINIPQHNIVPPPSENTSRGTRLVVSLDTNTSNVEFLESNATTDDATSSPEKSPSPELSPEDQEQINYEQLDPLLYGFDLGAINEQFYCEKFSNNDEVYDVFSDISDRGIELFSDSIPNCVDFKGQNSVLFEVEVSKCDNELHNTNKNVDDSDINKPGPSGLNKRKFSSDCAKIDKRAKKRFFPTNHSSDSSSSSSDSDDDHKDQKPILVTTKNGKTSTLKETVMEHVDKVISTPPKLLIQCTESIIPEDVDDEEENQIQLQNIEMRNQNKSKIFGFIRVSQMMQQAASTQSLNADSPEEKFKQRIINEYLSKLRELNCQNTENKNYVVNAEDNNLFLKVSKMITKPGPMKCYGFKIIFMPRILTTPDGVRRIDNTCPFVFYYYNGGSNLDSTSPSSSSEEEEEAATPTQPQAGTSTGSFAANYSRMAHFIRPHFIDDGRRDYVPICIEIDTRSYYTGNEDMREQMINEYINHYRIHERDLRSARVSDKNVANPSDQGGMVRLVFNKDKPITNLRVFVARNFKNITDRSIRHLSSIRLELLDLTGTSVTKKGIDEFLMLNPDCTVIHETLYECCKS